jgi:hypothetical protein
MVACRFALEYDGQATYMKTTLRHYEIWNLSLNTHEKNLLKSIPTSSKLWHPIDSNGVLIIIMWFDYKHMFHVLEEKVNKNNSYLKAI